jgi:hypothetical protein
MTQDFKQTVNSGQPFKLKTIHMTTMSIYYLKYDGTDYTLESENDKLSVERIKFITDENVSLHLSNGREDTFIIIGA